MSLPKNNYPKVSGDCPGQRTMLTPRQKEIAGFLSRTGLSYKEVASKLAIAEGTMRKHTENVYRKLGVHSRAELMIAMSQHLAGIAATS